MGLVNTERKPVSEAQVDWKSGVGNDGATLALTGHIDFDNCVKVMQEGERYLSGSAGTGKNVCIDVSGVENAHSVLLSVLLRWLALSEKVQLEASVSGLSGKMFEVARVSGIDTVLPIQ
ncbi:STAS domain-containing protein [Hahella ganghwensis]|uniref:STAS domain-containing protein n=1 Tax=Hahella ganghwensis TaxID=286420 RepID=UPI00036A2255|nr:STAS domain-containing protein [Hahella ganghwensis]